MRGSAGRADGAAGRGGAGRREDDVVAKGRAGDDDARVIGGAGSKTGDDALDVDIVQ